MGRRLVWFSCGAASAVLARLAVEQYGSGVEVCYCDLFASEHEDNRRFFSDVAQWIGQPITVLRSKRYATIDEVFERRRYMSGIAGAICTTEMKKAVREEYQRPGDIHLMGYTADEAARAEEFEERNPSLSVEWLLIDRWITKAECLRRVEAAWIALPAMYGLGYSHNNCIGCVKSQSPGYWNRTRRHFPGVFARRAVQSRAIGARLVKLGGQRIFLDELPPDADAPDDAIECGPACQIPLFTEAV